MSPARTRLIEEPFGRCAFRMTPDVVRALVPANVVGAYLLLKDANPLYVGRSDHCVRTRLAVHPLMGQAWHFVWEPCRNPFHAFCLESHWFHKLKADGQGLNFVHPARPAGDLRPCPFCSIEDPSYVQGALLANVSELPRRAPSDLTPEVN